jgi:hypothetical protein
MWIHLSDAFLSVVAHRHDSGLLLVRSRVAGDIGRVFPGVIETETPTADYRFRAVLPRKTVAAVLAEQVASIDYDNFKNSVAEDDRHDAYFETWGAMNRLQQNRARGSR